MSSLAQRRSTHVGISDGDMQAMMIQKACELFAVCDVENKGFITKREMQRLQNELPLEPQQLEAVFDSLDDDKNGYLTLDEFTNGFGAFLGIESPSAPDKKEQDEAPKEKVYEASRMEDQSLDDEGFHVLLDDIGATEVLDDVDGLKSMWAGLRENQPELLSNFEEFLHKVTSELKRTKGDYRSLQTALRNKTLSHDEEMRKLYEEMEVQITAEKQKILNEERMKEKQMKEDLEKELKEKDKQLQELIMNHQKMEQMLKGMNNQEFETKQENEKLMKDKRSLEAMLDESQRNLDESRSYINQLRSQQKEEKRNRALAALQVTEGIAIERESLVKQLDILREINRKLRDERDEAELRRLEQDKKKKLSFSDIEDEMSGNNMGEFGELAPNFQRSSSYMRDGNDSAIDSSASNTTINSPQSEGGDKNLGIPRRLQMKRGSVLSDYIPNMPWRPSVDDDMFEEEIECDDDHMIQPTHVGVFGSSAPRQLEDDDDGYYDGGRKNRSSQKREQPVGANSSADFTETRFQNYESMTPERVFKVVFVGDSGVGKSSFIHQFCCNAFKPAFQATIGVDFQVKNMKIDNHIIAIQVWDTAGQERFRSITKQYFRKADGVLVMYDVTNESSYRNIRNWMSSVQDGTEEGTVVMIVGNKMDLVDDDNPQIVSAKDGQRVAEEYSALFQEASAKTGSYVYESVEAMARLLMEREDQNMEKALQLTTMTKKKGCCK